MSTNSKQTQLKKLNYFEKQLVFYASYHSDPINVLVHIICVPMLLWSMFLALTKFGPLITSLKPSLFSQYGIDIDLGFIIAIMYSVYYIGLEKVAGTAYTPILLTLAVTATKFNANFPEYTLRFAALTHVLSWIAQIAAHAFAEKRAPALFDSFTQAISLAPFFVFLEVLFKFGYDQELHELIKERAALNRGAYWAQKLKSN